MNKVLVAKEHPLLVVEDIIARHGSGLTFTYSRYQVAQPGFQATAPRSAVLQVPACDITADWVIDRFGELGLDEELAWHSWVECEGAGFHIPMIDLVSSPTCLRLRQLSHMLETEMSLNGDFIFFETGRSFHGYSPGLIPERAWLKYLDRLLDLNERDWSQIIDVRWVGHARARGFSALRWSHNTDRYQAMPHLSAVFEQGSNLRIPPAFGSSALRK